MRSAVPIISRLSLLLFAAIGLMKRQVLHPMFPSTVKSGVPPPTLVTLRPTAVAAVQTLELVHVRRLKLPNCWTLQYWVEVTPLSERATPPPSAMPPFWVGTMFQVVFPVSDCSVVPLSWLPQNTTWATASNAHWVCSVTWMSPLTELQSPVFSVGVERRKTPPSSVSSSALLESKAIERESECGALPPVVWVCVIQVHMLPTA